MIYHLREAVPRLGYSETQGTSFLADTSVETSDAATNKHTE